MRKNLNLLKIILSKKAKGLFCFEKYIIFIQKLLTIKPKYVIIYADKNKDDKENNYEKRLFEKFKSVRNNCD